MSYIDELDLLLEAEGPSRRDFNKSVVGAMIGGNLIPNISMTGAASNTSAVAGAVSSSTAKLLSALNDFFLNNSKKYAFFSKIGGEKLGQVYDFLHAHPHMTMEEATAVEPLSKYFHYETNSYIADRDGPFFYTCFDSDTIFSSELEKIAFNNIYYPSENPHYDTLTTVIQYDQDGRLFANDGEITKHLASYFGSFKNYFKIFADSVVEYRNTASAQISGWGDVESDLLGFLLNAKEKAPLLYKSLGLKIDVEEYLRKKNEFWHKMQHDHSLKTAHEFKKSKHGFLDQLKKDGLLSDKLGKHIEIQDESAKELKSKVDEQDEISKQERIINLRNRTEHHLSNQKKRKNFDDEAMSRWEDEGGALGPVDEAIRRLLNVLY